MRNPDDLCEHIIQIVRQVVFLISDDGSEKGIDSVDAEISGNMLTVRVVFNNPKDCARFIGRHGRTVNALRHVLYSAAMLYKVAQVYIDVVDPQGRYSSPKSILDARVQALSNTAPGRIGTKEA